MTSAAAIHEHLSALPFVSLPQLLCAQPPLILAPHPDDESLGCGGLIAACARSGMSPVVVFLTGCSATSGTPPACLLGVDRDRLAFLHLRDHHFPQHGRAFDTVATDIAAIAALHGCGSIYAPWQHDPDEDNAATWNLATEAAGLNESRLLAYPVWSWTLPADADIPDNPPHGVRLDISSHLAAKRAALRNCSRLPPGIDAPYEVFVGAA